MLRLHPKFCIPERINIVSFEHEQESAFAKLRMEFKKQEENQDLSEEEIQECDEFEARIRQVFDPETKEYDSRRKRATDMAECNRVTLPKPLSAEDEAKLDLRRTTQAQIFKDWLDKNTDKNNDQKSNLTPDEQEGLKSLQTRIKKGDLVIIKTDKSSKLAVTNRDEYIKMGQDHVAKDRIIDRQELIELEETLNGHSKAWCHIWGSGKDHKHFERILTSKVTHSENVANLYLMFKDHKPGTKTRPTATGHSSNSLGLSNAVAEILESVANSEQKRYNTISSEDMLSRLHEYNKKVLTRNSRIQESLASQGVPEPWDPPPKSDKKTCIIGSDVKALYPSIKSESTGKIIRSRLEKSKIKLEGFNMKMGLAYIAMNQHLTTEVDKISYLLPERKSGRSTQLKMSAIKNDWDPTEKFEFKDQEYTPLEIRQVQARVVEVATRALFENHAYKFGNIIYKQMSGGSIGDRWTGAAAELVVQDWAEQYEEILTRSGIEVDLLAGYVDDGRQGTTILEPGMKYNPEDKKFKYCAEQEKDDMTRKQSGETDNQRMARLCLVAMNAINDDLEFTVECEDDFEDKKLPTLDFQIWQDKNGVVNHTYYQKPMKTPLIIMARSATPNQQKIQILSNELTRRLLNVNKNMNEQAELNKVVDQFCQEARNSGYTQLTTKEMVISGVRAWKGRLARRKELGQDEYRGAASTLKTRTRKKLMARENWYKTQDNANKTSNKKTNGLPGGPRALGPLEKNENDKKPKQNDKNPIRAVMFVPYTTNGTLAKLLRQNEEKLEELTGTKLKIVERSGTKLVDILTKSNPWQGQDCSRKNCLLCHTKMRTDKNTSQDCSKRNIVYETTCVTCERQEIEAIENSELDEKTKNDKKRNISLFKYIGESSRSSYERGWEHVNDLTSLNPRSHMLKHILSHHPDQDILSIEFSMKVKKFCSTSFERQILESVTIQQERNNHQLMNSKAEYNRCSLPRLTTKMGEQEYEEYNENLSLEQQEEEQLEKKIRELRKKLNKARLHPTKERGPKAKRRKVGTEAFVSIDEIWGTQEIMRQEKNRISEDETPRQSEMPEMEQKSPEKKIPTFPPPPVVLSSKARKEKLRKEKEMALELQNICKTFLEENDKGWEKRKKERVEELERKERLEKCKIKSKDSKIKHLEKKIIAGMEQIPELERKELERQEKDKWEQEYKQTRQDLWKLRKREKKLVENETTRKIKGMAHKLEKIAEILEQEKNNKLEQDKQINIKLKKKEELKKLANEKAEKWAMLRWVNNYIDENQEKWDSLELVKTQEKFEREECEKKIERIQLAKSKKRKFEAEPEQETTKPEKQENPKKKTSNTENWTTWRQDNIGETAGLTTTSTTNAEKTSDTTIPSKEKITKITIKLKQPTLFETKKKTQKETDKLEKTIPQQQIENNQTNNENKKKTSIDPEIEVKLRQPVLIVEPQKTTKEKTSTIKNTKETTQQKITSFFNNETENEITNKIKPKLEQQEKQPVLNNKNKKETKKMKQEKERKQAQGFWTKYAENRRKIKENCENSESTSNSNSNRKCQATVLNNTEQAHCNSADHKSDETPCTPVHQDRSRVTHGVFESEISNSNQITLGTEMKGKVI